VVDIRTVQKLVEEKSKEFDELIGRGKSITFNMGKLHSALELREEVLRIFDEEMERLKKVWMDRIRSRIAKSEVEENVDVTFKNLREFAEGVDDCLRSFYRLKRVVEETIDSRIYKILDELE